MPPLPHLEPTEQRVLGALLEKQVTVPTSYPLTVNALRTACNQSTSRDPVVDYDDQTVESSARALKGKGLVRVVWDGRGQRTLKFHQLLDEALGLDPGERALITSLLLRGPQSAGELRTRTERLHGFTDRAAVEDCLTGLASREEPLVQELARLPGWQDPRWIHLLGPVELPSHAHAASEAVDLESILAEGPQARDAKVSAAYDSLAGEYATRLAPDLDDTPFERWLLERVVDLAGGHPVADVGCGPGLISAYLRDHGARVVGSDLQCRDGCAGSARPSRHHVRGARPAAPDPPRRCGWVGRGARVVLPRAPRRVRASRGDHRPRSPAAPGRPRGAQPVRRSIDQARRRAMGHPDRS